MHHEYAESLAEFGTPRQLIHSKGWILEREIPGTPYKDAMGVYPLFCCRDWGRLGEDIERLDGLVSLVLVADPLGDYDDLDCFDFARPFKEHFVIDLKNVQICKHHRRNIQKARKSVCVELCLDPLERLNDWARLYGKLIEKHDIQGIAKFSRVSFRKQLQVPGLIMFRAMFEDEAVGMSLWYAQGDVGYYHLGASSEKGYELRASFALFQTAIEFFEGDLRWLNLGAGAGARAAEMDGLARFKRGWTAETRPAYLCGKVLNHEIYRELTGDANGDFFPAYRKWAG